MKIALTAKEAIEIFLNENPKYKILKTLITSVYEGGLSIEYTYDVIFKNLQFFCIPIVNYGCL